MIATKGASRTIRPLLAVALVGALLAAIAVCASDSPSVVGRGKFPGPTSLTPPPGEELTWPDLDASGTRRGRAPGVEPQAPGLSPLIEPQQPSLAVAAAALAPPDPLVEEVAAALNYDPLAIFNYVKTEIAFEPTYGLLREPRRTVLERAGTDADQAYLLADLLRSAGLSPAYEFGTVTVPLDLAAAWVRVEEDPSVFVTCSRVFWAFSGGGVPVSTVQPCGDDITEQFTVQHVWVRVDIGPTTHHLDPSVKWNEPVPGVDLLPATGYDRAAFRARAEDGATITPISVQGLNAANIAEDLDQYAANLVSYIETRDAANGSRSYVQDIVGGWALTEPSAGALPETLPYPSVVTATFTDFDDPSAPELRHKVTIAVDECFFICSEVISEVTTLSAIVGRRLTYAMSPDLFGVLGTLRLEGATLATWSSFWGDPQRIRFCVDAPFPAYGGTYGDQCSERWVYPVEGNTYALVTEVGHAPDSLLSERRSILDANQDAYPPGSEPLLGETLNVLGLSWFNETGKADRLHGAIAGVNGYRFHAMAVMAQETYSATSFGIDVQMDFVHNFSPVFDAEDESAYFTGAGAQGSATEHAFIEQLQDKPAISTIKALNLANPDMPVFLARTPADWSAVRPQLCYDSNTLAGLDGAISAGWSVVVPQCEVTLVCWEGTGWVQFAPNGEGYIIHGGLNPACVPPSAATAVARKRLGGSPGVPGPVDSEQALDPIRQRLDAQFGLPNAEAERVLDPVDPLTGFLTLAETDVSVAGARPLSIEDFARYYNSGTAGAGGPLGFGWRDTYHRTLQVYSDYGRGLEGPMAVEAARLIVQVFVAHDLIRNPDLDAYEHERRVIQAIATQWGMDQLTNNAIALTGPDRANGAFVSIPGGYSRSARLPWDLIENPDGSRTLDGRAGEEQLFDEVVPGASWRLASWKDGNGNTLGLAYDSPGATGKLTQVTDAVGRTLTFTYAGDLITQVTDPLGRAHAYEYDGAGNLVRHTDPRGALTPGDPNDFVTTYAYDSLHRMLSITDPLGQTYVSNVFDSSGRVTQQTDGRGHVSLLYYGDHLTRVRNPLGDDRVVAWTPDGRRQRVTDEGGFTTTSHYDAAGNLVRLEEPEGATSTFEYDLFDNLRKSTDALGNQTVFVYDADSRPTLIRDPALHETSFTYDIEGNLESTTNAPGQTTTYAYDAAGRLTDIFEPLTGAHTHMTYDAVGNLETTTNPESEITTFVSDAAGQLLTVTDPLGNSTGFGYDYAGNRTSVTDPLSHTTTFEYDANNLLVRTTDPRGRPSENDYDSMNNLVLTTRPDSTTIGFTYDAMNRLVTVVDPRGKLWTVEREERGLVKAEIDPLGNRREFQYDGLSRLVKRTDAEARVTDYVYDAASRLIDTVYAGGSTVHNTYNADGLLLTSSYGDWNAGYEYDALHRITAEDYPYLGRRVEHRWDELLPEQSVGDRVQLILKVGASTKLSAAYEYDAAHRLTSMTDETGISSYTYDNAGRLLTTALPNGASIEHSYDDASRILTVVNKDAAAAGFAGFEYFYDDAGNVTGVTHTTPQAVLPTTYTYDLHPATPEDDLDRLLEEATPRGVVSYTYDAAGNRLTRADAAGTTAYAYDDANELLSAGAATYGYDGNGNLTSRTVPSGTATFAWDHENRLTGITPPSGPAVTFAYDPLGRQIMRQEAGGPALHRTYDGLRLLAEGPADLSLGLVYGGGARRLEHRRDLSGDTAPVGYGVDRLGSVLNLTDSAGQPRDAYRYDAFGSEARAAGLDANGFRFGGSFGAEREPAAPGLVRMGFRYYDTESGRFISRDPIGFLGDDTNLYAYTGNNPATFADPQGLSRKDPPASKQRPVNCISWFFGIGADCSSYAEPPNPRWLQIAAWRHDVTLSRLGGGWRNAWWNLKNPNVSRAHKVLIHDFIIGGVHDVFTRY